MFISSSFFFFSTSVHAINTFILLHAMNEKKTSMPSTNVLYVHNHAMICIKWVPRMDLKSCRSMVWICKIFLRLYIDFIRSSMIPMWRFERSCSVWELNTLSENPGVWQMVWVCRKQKASHELYWVAICVVTKFCLNPQIRSQRNLDQTAAKHCVRVAPHCADTIGFCM